MARSDSLRRDYEHGLDDVDEYIRHRQLEGARRSASARRSERDAGARSQGRRPAAPDSTERVRARELLGTEFFWSELASTSSAGAAPSPEALTRAWDDSVEVREITDDSILPAAPTTQALALVPDSSDGSTPTRRTIVITGRGSERYVAPRRSQDARLRRHERSGFKPDRVAMWAVLLGLALLLGAATSSHAAALHAALEVAH